MDDGVGIVSLRCREFIDAGIGETRFSIERTERTCVSAASVTPGQAWESYRERLGAEVPEGMLEAVQAANSFSLDDAAIRRVLAPALVWLKERRARIPEVSGG